MQKRFEDKYAEDNKYCKVRDHCHYAGEYRGTVHSICNLKYTISEKSNIIFHSVSNYDYHFTLKELAEEFDGR